MAKGGVGGRWEGHRACSMEGQTVALGLLAKLLEIKENEAQGNGSRGEYLCANSRPQEVKEDSRCLLQDGTIMSWVGRGTRVVKGQWHYSAGECDTRVQGVSGWKSARGSLRSGLQPREMPQYPQKMGSGLKVEN